MMRQYLDVNPPHPDDADERRKIEERQEYHEQMQTLRDERLREHAPIDPRPARRVKRADANRGGSPGLWRDAVLNRDQGCRVHSNPADCAEGWAAHHVVPQQTLRRYYPDALWNPLSGMVVCGLAHRQHHNRHRPITLDEIPPLVNAYLRSHGFGAYIDRHYDLVWLDAH